MKTQALKPDMIYQFENPETGEVQEASGRAVAAKGFRFDLPPRAGALWLYRALEGTRD